MPRSIYQWLPLSHHQQFWRVVCGSYHFPWPPSNAISTAQVTEQIKFTKLIIKDKVPKLRRPPLKVSIWKTVVCSTLEYTRDLVKNAFPAIPLPLLSNPLHR
jgi:hypothetical protein